MTVHNSPIISDLVVRERDILTRIAAGGPLAEVLRDLVLLVEQPSNGEMLASILFVSPDGKQLLEGAAPSLPTEYNDAIHGIAIGENVGSCGTAAYLGGPVIVSDIANDPHWKDFRDLALKHNLRACWSVPIKAADGSVLGTYANYYREPKEPTERDMEIISMVARTTGIAIERHRHELARKRGEEQRDLLFRELNHRVKNVFVLASSIVAMSVRTATSPQELAEVVQGRLTALGRAHDLVTSEPIDAAAAQEEPIREGTATFRAVVNGILAPYVDDMTKRVKISSEDFPLAPTSINGIALIIHELTTNAVKYGCLTKPGGLLTLHWDFVDERLHFHWVESGSAGQGAPRKAGFGTTLMDKTVERQFEGMIVREWKPDGLSVAITIPQSVIARSAHGGASK